MFGQRSERWEQGQFSAFANDRTVSELKHAPVDFYDPSALHLLENQQRISNHEQLCSKF